MLCVTGLQTQTNRQQLCLGAEVDLQQRACDKDMPSLVWKYEHDQLTPTNAPGFCLDRYKAQQQPMMPCRPGKDSQLWKFFPSA